MKRTKSLNGYLRGMEDKVLAERSYALIKQDFGLENDFDASPDDPMTRLEDFLTRVVSHLLDKDFNRLMNALYRIDVSEQKVKEVLELSHPDDMARNLAQVIIEREKLKVALRAKYSS